jgi:hypothetical protein
VVACRRMTAAAIRGSAPLTVTRHGPPIAPQRRKPRRRAAIYQSRKFDVCDEVGGLRWHRLSLREGSGPDRHPPSPRCDGGRGRLDSPIVTPNHASILKCRRGFFATKFRPKSCRRGAVGNRYQLAAAEVGRNQQPRSARAPAGGTNCVASFPTMSVFRQQSRHDLFLAAFPAVAP